MQLHVRSEPLDDRDLLCAVALGEEDLRHPALRELKEHVVGPDPIRRIGAEDVRVVLDQSLDVTPADSSMIGSRASKMAGTRLVRVPRLRLVPQPGRDIGALLRVTRVALLLTLILFGSRTARGADYPADPFADAYRAPIAEEVGTGAGQTRLMLLGGVAGFQGAEILGLTTVEQMTIAFIGVRVTSSLVIAKPAQAQTVASLRVGPSLHLLPYRVLDVGIYVEGGLATVDPFAARRLLMPEVAGGLTVDLSFDPYWFVRLGGDAVWGVASRDGAGAERLRFSAVLGLGYIL